MCYWHSFILQPYWFALMNSQNYFHVIMKASACIDGVHSDKTCTIEFNFRKLCKSNLLQNTTVLWNSAAVFSADKLSTWHFHGTNRIAETLHGTQFCILQTFDVSELIDTACSVHAQQALNISAYKVAVTKYVISNFQQFIFHSNLVPTLIVDKEQARNKIWKILL